MILSRLLHVVTRHAKDPPTLRRLERLLAEGEARPEPEACTTWLIFWCAHILRCEHLGARLHEDAWVPELDVDLGLVDAFQQHPHGWRPTAHNDRSYG